MRHAETASPPRVLGVVGDLVEDIVVWFAGERRYATDNPATIHRSRGGSAANVAALASGLIATRFIGCVGSDAMGDTLIAELRRHDVDVRAQRRGRSGCVVVLVDETGERTMFPDRAAAGELADVPLSWLDSLGVLHAPSYCFATQPAADAAEKLLIAARDAGIEVSLDASSTGLIEEYGLARYLKLIEALRPTVYFANAHEAQLLGIPRPQFANMLTVVKDGGRRTTLHLPGGQVQSVAVPPVRAVRDSTGAGDAFAAGFLAARLRGATPSQAAEAGHALAHTVLLSPGASRRHHGHAAGSDGAPTESISRQGEPCG